MMRINIFILVSLAVLRCSASQITFQRTYGIGTYNEGRSVKQTLDGGYIIAGTVSDAGSGSTDVYLLKVDSFGNPIWNKLIGGTAIDRGYSVEQLSDSGYAVAGFTNSYGHGGYDGYLIRTDKNGDTLWTRTYGTSDWDFIYAMKKTSDGGFILVGNSYGNISGASEAWMIKTDSQGIMEWEKSVPINAEIFMNAVAISPDNAYVLAGYKINSADGDEDLFVIKTNAVGDTLWTRSIGTAASYEHANGVDVSLTDSSIFAVGYASDLATNNSDHYIVKLDSYGSIVIIQSYAQPAADALNDVHVTGSGILMAGYTASFGGGNKDTHYILADNMGYYITGFTHGGTSDDIAYHIEATSDGGYILCGTSDSYTPGLQSIYVLKLDSGFQTSSLVLGTQSEEEMTFKAGNYPNPFHDYTTIVLNRDIPLKNIRFSVFTMMGENVFNAFPVDQHEIKFFRNDLPAGIYFYEVDDSENRIAIGKLLIE